MRRNCVYTPDGVKVTVDLDDPNLMQFIQEHLLDPYLPLIESGWLDASKKNGFTTLEDRIKKYLERLATLLLQDPGKYAILTESMQRRIAVREMELTDYMEEKPRTRTKRVYQMKVKSTPRSEKLHRIRAQHPGTQLCWQRVDVDGFFLWEGRRYQVTHPAYTPIQLTCDLYYPMDRIVIQYGQGELHFYTDSIDLIEPHHVMCVDSSPCRYGAQIEAGGIEHDPHDEQEDV